MADDTSRALNFYAERRYGGGIRPEDLVLLAEHDGQLVGIVRLTAEEGVVVLRGMQVHPRFQRQGIGKRLLATVAQELDDRGCFCIPYAHLVGFYGGIGFRPIEPAKAPTFLRLRLKKYQDRSDGNKYLIIRREGVQEASSQVLNSTITPEQFEILLPLASEWAAAQEQRILAMGEALSNTMLGDARLVGVAVPERVRLLYVPEIPIPDDPALRAAALETQFLSPLSRGLTLRYGIFIRSDCKSDRRMVIHELGHTAQYERLGGFEPFLRRYLFECLSIGYPEAPMEQEVIALTARICGS